MSFPRGGQNKAFDNDLVSGDTLKAFKKVKKPLKRSSNAGDNIISPEQFRALLDSESLPMHIRGILGTAFYSRMRTDWVKRKSELRPKPLEQMPWGNEQVYPLVELKDPPRVSEELQTFLVG